jgi:hypothetical protein
MSSYIHRSSDLDRGFSRREDPEEVHRARTRRLVARLFRVVRPTLATQPPRRENVYIALDAVAWAAAMILTGSEDRDALDFFTLALTQNLARFEARNDEDLPSGLALAGVGSAGVGNMPHSGPGNACVASASATRAAPTLRTMRRRTTAAAGG